MLYVIGPYDKAPENALVINTTSRSDTWSRSLSPFLCGPCKLYGGHTSINVENAWQFAKVYKYYIGDDGNPDDSYFKWAKEGWGTIRGIRYPMGHDAKPEYSWWDGEKLGYIEARKRIYIPLYAAAVQKTHAFKRLKDMFEDSAEDIYLWDFDGYNRQFYNMTYKEVVNNPNKTMGHAFVIAMLLEGFLE